MLLHCLKCRKKYRMLKPKSCNEKKNGGMLLLKCEVCTSEKLKFIKEQEASGLLSSLGIKTPLTKTPLLGPLLF